MYRHIDSDKPEQMAEESSAAAQNSAESARHLDAISRKMRATIDAYRLQTADYQRG